MALHLLSRAPIICGKIRTVAIGLLVVLAAAAAGLGILFVRWFERYRMTDRWRRSDARAAALSFLLFFGGLFGYRLPPPPRPGIESRHDDPRAGPGQLDNRR